MNVSLIDYTGRSHSDPLYAAKLLVYTKNTRLEQGVDTRAKIFNMPQEELDKELEYISKTIRSSWEFVDYVFEIKGVTRAFTHQLVRTRTGSYAQQSQRSVSMKEFSFETPATCQDEEGAGAVWESCMKSIQRHYDELQRLGVPTQDARGVLPTNIHTNIIAKFNLRTLADLVGKRDNLRAQGEYTNVIRAMVKEVLAVQPWVEIFLYPERLATPNIEAILTEQLGIASPIDKPRINAALKELDGLKGTWG